LLQDGTIDETLQFPVEILDPCAADELKYRPGIQSFQYDLTTPESILFRAPTIIQSNAGLCPIKCVLREAAGDQNSIPDVISMVNDRTGEIRVMTGAKSLSDLTFSYELKCMSTLSEV
jgi:hypothetical protein